ncbi:MAG: hypothetical protein LC135_00435 [Phycisphaerae bacterium]|nr:hypothetical protein [Phycisphaerae bacterium]MCZ2398319.1 hypothetical protein [Phycisphaerae bacterium]
MAVCPADRRSARHAVCFLLAALAAPLAGCSGPAPAWSAAQNGAAGPLTPADTGFTSTQPPATLSETRRPPIPTATLSVLNVRVPRHESAKAEALWTYVREQVLDLETRSRLAQNGVRVGIGHVEWWNAVRSLIDTVEGVDVVQADPVLLRPRFPLVLQMDRTAREQTLFYVGREGGLSGGTWPASRNLIRIDVVADAQEDGAAHLRITPTIWQRFEGVRYTRAPDGWQLAPDERQSPLGDVSFVVTLRSGEFLLLAPGEHARVFGLVGHAFLTGNDDGREYHSYVFIRPEVERVNERR